MFSFHDFFSDFINFIVNIIVSIQDFVFNNKLIFYFVFVPIFSSCFIVFIDMIFDIRDMFGDVSKFHDYLPYTKMKLYNKFIKPKKKSQLDMEDVYTRSKELADYKHNLKVTEMNMYKENEQLRHSHKMEEFKSFPQSKNTSTNTNSNINSDSVNIQTGNDVQGFVNYIKEFEPKKFDTEIRKQERKTLYDNYYERQRINREREQFYSEELRRKKINLDIDVEDDI